MLLLLLVLNVTCVEEMVGEGKGGRRSGERSEVGGCERNGLSLSLSLSA
jgi:hypothetical protein